VAFKETTFRFPREGGKYQLPGEEKTIRRVFLSFTLNLPNRWDS
jgi:hypothetical protein